MDIKIKKNITVLSVILLVGVVGALAFNFPKKATEKPKDLTSLIKENTQDTKLIDANTDHNQALDVAEYAVKKGIKFPEIIINFDTHSDVYLNYPVMEQDAAGVESWINELFVKNPNLKELYWVMPNEESNKPSLQTLFAENDFSNIENAVPLYGNSLNDDVPWLYFVFNPLYKKAYPQEFLVNLRDGVINEYSRNEQINNLFFKKKYKYKKIKIITCTKETLPNFNGKKVFLSIDADYTSNSGFDTVDDFKINKTPTGISNTFYDIFKTIKDKNIKPEIISMSLSPQYLPKKDHEFVNNLFKEIIQISGMRDEINTYKRRYDPDPHYIEKHYDR